MRRRSLPAVKRAQAAGIVVVAVDVAAAGADATVQTNNVQAGEIACQFIVRQARRQGRRHHPERAAGLGGDRPRQGLQGGARQESGHQDPVRRPGRQGLPRGRPQRHAGPSHPLPEDRRACSRSTIRRPSAPTSPPSSSTATSIVITSVDGAPDIEAALKGDTHGRRPRPSQDPYAMAQQAVRGRLRHHERQEAGRADDPDALDPDHARQRRRLQGLVLAALPEAAFAAAGGPAPATRPARTSASWPTSSAFGELLIDFVPTRHRP